jgi:NADP-dependent 3-hydroxy acid dehydrogenase YdfG
VIEGKVARVLDTKTLVINRGSSNGVEAGMTFEVLDTTGTDIRDPETGEPIGSVLRPKVRVRVTEVQPELAVATTYRTWRRNIGGTASWAALSSRQFLPPRWITQRETFKTDEAAWEAITEDESFVKTGDPVRQVIEDEAEPDDSQP